jgi:hypothetical protein
LAAAQPRQESLVPDFDLQPDPRILPMLGEINLHQWRCLAELIDNSVDGFLDVIAQGGTLVSPEVHVMVPTADVPSAQVTITDNGPGMSDVVLEKAVRAGWSGNTSVGGKLGLFGMGFNIATARLGTVTTVWTTKAGDAEWVGVRIDFDQLRQQRHFRTPRITQPKTDPSQHGTRIIIEKLKPEQRQWFAKGVNRSNVRRELSRVYSSMLQPGGVPLQFKLIFDTRAVEPRRHCVWSGPGNTARTVDTGSRFGVVDAYQPIDVQMEDRPYCQECWQWLGVEETACPVCGRTKDVANRKRTIRGWVGVQRYLSETDFGIDFIRNGRKIEIGNKDLLVWTDGDRVEPEYPIDDPRGRGRIVGEIHLDHCRVTYTKDRFERTDPAWEDMTKAVRGEGPLRPDKADALGFGPNFSSLFKLFNVFRRSTPKARVAKAWQRLIVAPDNNVAEEFAKRFYAGDAGYQTDDKWWDLVVEEDRKLLTPGSAPSPAPGPAPGPGASIPGFGGLGGPAPVPGGPPPIGPGAPSPAPPPRQTGIPSLSHRFICPSLRLQWNIQAYEVDATHSQLSGKRPWLLKANANGVHEYFVDVSHEIFASATMTPLDGLLAELAYSAMDEQRDLPGDSTYGSILWELRSQYATTSALDPAALASQARQTLQEIARIVGAKIPIADAPALFRDLSDAAQRAVLERMVRRGATSPQAITASGKFLEYAPSAVLRDFFEEHPALFLDGNCWDDPYSTINFNDPQATELARQQVVRRYQSLLEDAAWLADQDPSDLEQASRAKVLRALHSLELLAPIEAEGTDSP